MNFNPYKIFAAAAVGAMFSLNASAETVEATMTVDFENLEIGHRYNSFWGGPNEHITVVADPTNPENKALYLDGCSDPDQDPDAWSTKAKIPGLVCPKGFNLSNLVMITADYYATVDKPAIPLSIQFFNFTDQLNSAEEPVLNEWASAVFDAADIVYTDENQRKTGSFDFTIGMNGSTRYYVDNIVFYFEKEVTQRELDEMALDKETAACQSLNFDDMPEGPSQYLGSNGGAKNREDMIFDKGPEGYDNMCVHIIYGGWSHVHLWDLCKAPEGYTFDDLRQVEYDIYQTDQPGVDCTTGESHTGNVTPTLKVKDRPWSLENNANGDACGNGALEADGKWHHVEFAPSQLNWTSRTFTEGEGDDAHEVTWTPEEYAAAFGKLTEFSISVGGKPALNQCYVDNVKLWYQKSANSAAVSTIGVEKAADAVYNLQGVRVASDVKNLPAGLYIVNGKKISVR